MTSTRLRGQGALLKGILSRLDKSLLPKLARFSRASVSTGQSSAGGALADLVKREVSAGLSGIFGRSPGTGAPSSAGGNALLASSVSVAPRGRAFSPRQMETALDQMVASSLVNGQHTSGVLRTLFGLVPSLIGR